MDYSVYYECQREMEERATNIHIHIYTGTREISKDQHKCYKIIIHHSCLTIKCAVLNQLNMID